MSTWERGHDGTYLPADQSILWPYLHAYEATGNSLAHSTANIDFGHWGEGEIVSTAADLATFCRALLGGKLVQPALAREMLMTVPKAAGPAVPLARPTQR